MKLIVLVFTGCILGTTNLVYAQDNRNSGVNSSINSGTFYPATGPENRIDRFNDPAYNLNGSNNLYSNDNYSDKNSNNRTPDLSSGRNNGLYRDETSESLEYPGKSDLEMPQREDYYEKDNLNQNKYLRDENSINATTPNISKPNPSSINTPGTYM